MENQQLSELFGLFLANDGYIVVHKSIIKLFGNSEANFLAELISEYKYYKKEGMLLEYDDKNWFFSTINNIEENISFTKKQQIGIIKNLTNYIDNYGNNIQIIETKQMGMPQQRYFYINFDAIYQLLKDNADIITKNYKNKKKINNKNDNVQNDAKNVDFSRSAKRELQEVPKGDFKKCQIGTSESAKRELQEVPKGATNNNNITSNNITKINNIIYPQVKLTEINEKEDEEISSQKLDLIDKFNKQVNYTDLVAKYEKSDKKQLFDGVYSVIISIFSSNKEYYVVSGEKIKTADLINKILDFNSQNIDFVIDKLLNTPSEIQNIKSYIISLILDISDNSNLYNFKIQNKSNNNHIKLVNREEYNKLFINSVLNNK